MTASAITTTPCCAVSWTVSVSNTSSSPPPTGYGSGRFDETLLRVLRHYDQVMELMLPTLGAERRETYSPFLPISPTTGRVLQVPVVARDADAGTIAFIDEDAGWSRPGHRRPLQAAMEAGLGDALGGAERRLRKCRART